MKTGFDDPFPSSSGASGLATVSPAFSHEIHKLMKQPSAGPQAAQFLEQATHHQALNKSLLKLTRILEKRKRIYSESGSILTDRSYLKAPFYSYRLASITAVSA